MAITYNAGQFARDPQKERYSRQVQYDWIAKTFTQEERWNEGKVVFLTGDTTAEYEMYLNLGFAPKNIIGVERSAKAFGLVAPQVHNINRRLPSDNQLVCVHGDVVDVLASGIEDITVAALDFDLNYGPTVRDAMMNLTIHDTLADKAVVYFNLQGRRENADAQKRLQFYDYALLMRGANDLKEVLDPSKEAPLTSAAHIMEESYKNIKIALQLYELPLQAARLLNEDPKFNAVLRTNFPLEFIMSLGASTFGALDLSDVHSYVDSLEENGVIRKEVHTHIDNIAQIAAKYGDVRFHDPLTIAAFTGYSSTFLQKALMHKIGAKDDLRKLLNGEVSDFMLNYALMQACNPHKAFDDTSTFYVSESKCPMNGFLFTVNRTMTSSLDYVDILAKHPYYQFVERLFYSGKSHYVTARNYLESIGLTVNKALVTSPVKLHTLLSRFRVGQELGQIGLPPLKDIAQHAHITQVQSVINQSLVLLRSVHNSQNVRSDGYEAALESMYKKNPGLRKNAGLREIRALTETEIAEVSAFATTETFESISSLFEGQNVDFAHIYEIVQEVKHPTVFVPATVVPVDHQLPLVTAGELTNDEKQILRQMRLEGKSPEELFSAVPNWQERGISPNSIRSVGAQALIQRDRRSLTQ